MTPTCRRAPGNHRGSRIPPGSAGLCWLLLSFAGAAPVLAEEAPRPLLLNFGADDEGSPIQEVREGVKLIAEA